MTIKAGDAVINGAGMFAVLEDGRNGELRLVNLYEGFIYEYDNTFATNYITEYGERLFNLCEVLKKVKHEI